MRKIITKQALIRNLLKRTVTGEAEYLAVRAKLKAYDSEKRRINVFHTSTSDDIILSKINHYVKLVDDILIDIRELPTVRDVPNIKEFRQWAEGLVTQLAFYPKKGNDLKHHFSSVVFGYEKLINAELYARNI